MLIIIKLQEKHWCKASKGVHARNAVSEDDLVDIWWLDILINFSMVNWFLQELYIYEWADERHCSLWTLVGMLEIRIFIFSSGTWNSININDYIQNIQVISKVQLVVWIYFIFHISFPANFSSSVIYNHSSTRMTVSLNETTSINRFSDFHNVEVIILFIGTV
jgi:hypothetical protein